MKKPLVVLAAVLAVAMALPAVPVAAATSFGGQPVPVAATTVIHWEGLAGVQIDIPEGVDLRNHLNKITLSDDAEMAFVSWETPGCEHIQPGGHWGCLLQQWLAHFSVDTFSDTSDPGIERELFAGVNTLYLFSDGAATLSLALGGLPEGSQVEVTATGHIDGTLERLPCTAAAPLDCDHVAYGGKTRDVGHGRVAAVWGMTVAAVHNNPPPGASQLTGGNSLGVKGARSCVYPGTFFGTASSDPDDYPYGCQQGFEDDPTGINNVASDHIQHALRISDRGSTTWQFNANTSAQGEVYVGWQAERGDALEAYYPPDGGVAAWGVWFYRGVTCPCS